MPRAASTSVAVDLAHADVGVGEDRRDREQHERERDVREARRRGRRRRTRSARGSAPRGRRSRPTWPGTAPRPMWPSHSAERHRDRAPRGRSRRPSAPGASRAAAAAASRRPRCPPLRRLARVQDEVDRVAELRVDARHRPLPGDEQRAGRRAATRSSTMASSDAQPAGHDDVGLERDVGEDLARPARPRPRRTRAWPGRRSSWPRSAARR